jgi:hypothetical protein
MSRGDMLPFQKKGVPVVVKKYANGKSPTPNYRANALDERKKRVQALMIK